ncbi:hypothetical protein ACF0H5_000580 [Mactra antiquata]
MEKMYLLKTSVSVMVLVTVLVFDECGGRKFNRRYNDRNGLPISYLNTTSRIFTKVEQVVSTDVTASFVTTKTDTMVMNTTVTSTSRLTIIQIPTLSTAVTSTVSALFTHPAHSTVGFTSGDVITSGQTVCSIQVTPGVMAGANTVALVDSMRTVTVIVGPVLTCSSTQTVG